MTSVRTMTSAWSLAALALRAARDDGAALAFQRAPGHGPCRGPGGPSDKVNGRYAGEVDEDACRAHCAATPACNGYTHSPAINEGDCVLHGAGLAGTCADAAHAVRGACEGAGSTWTGPENTEGRAWTGESWHSTVVAGTTDEVSSSYVCWELDDDDHLAQCAGDGCAFSADERVPGNCQATGCTFVAAPEMPPAKPPHPGDVGLPGWGRPLSGACRGGPDGTDKVNGLYAAKDSQTQAQCAAKCRALAPRCTGYHHGPYCSVFGPGVDAAADPDGEDAVWFVTAGNETVVTGTKENDQYLCFLEVPTTAGAGTAAAWGGAAALALAGAVVGAWVW